MVTAPVPARPVAAPAPDPPGPKGMPWFGSLGEVRANPMRFYTRVALEYGGIARFFYGRKPTYLVSTPELIREFLVEKRELYVKNTRYALLRRAIGNGLLNSEGQTWQEQRTASQPGFSRSRILNQVVRTAAVAREHVERWEPNVGSSTPHDVEPDFSSLIQYLIGYSLLGPGFREIGERFTGLVEEMRTYWPKPPRSLLGHWRPPQLGRIKRLKRALAEIDELIFAAIREQRRADAVDDSLLSILARAEVGEERRRFDEQELRDQLLTLYHAGFETSASTLTFLFYRLSLQPEIRGRLEQEVRTVLGARDPEADDLAALVYTEQCINEALRIYPPAYNFTRVMLEDTTVGGYRVEKGCMVIVSPYATHRLPELWPNPEGFDPDRFSEQRAAGRSQFAFIPFGAGHRYCIGGPLAMAQMKTIVAVVARRYRLDVEAGHPVEPVPGTVMRPSHGMPMRITRL